MPQHIEVISRGIMQFDGMYLLCRCKRGGYLYLPGGHVEFGEGAREALAREFLEEAGLKVRVGELVGMSEGCFRHKGKRHHEVNFLFHVEPRARSFSAVKSLEREIEFEWASPAAIKKLDVRPASAKMLLLGKSARNGPGGVDFVSAMKR